MRFEVLFRRVMGSQMVAHGVIMDGQMEQRSVLLRVARRRLGDDSVTTDLQARLEKLGYESRPLFRDPMASFGPYVFDAGETAHLDLRALSMPEDTSELRRAFDEGHLDGALARGAPVEVTRVLAPEEKTQGEQVFSGKAEIQKLRNALCEMLERIHARFDGVVKKAELGEDGCVQLVVTERGFVSELAEHGVLVDGLPDPAGELIRMVFPPNSLLRDVDFFADALTHVLKHWEAERDIDAVVPALVKPSHETRVRRLTADDAHDFVPKFVALEASIFEPARRDPPEKLRRAFDDPDGVVVAAEVKRDGVFELAGFSLAFPLEKVHVDGPTEDTFFGAENTLYAASTTLGPASRGLGLGLRLKFALVEAAAAMLRDDGTPRYEFITGRNQLGSTGAMQRVNARLGAYEVKRYFGQYDGDGIAIYYRMPVGPIRRRLDDKLVCPPKWRMLIESGEVVGTFLRPQPIFLGMLPSTVNTLERFSKLLPAHPCVSVFSTLNELGAAWPRLQLSDKDEDSRFFSTHDAATFSSPISEVLEGHWFDALAPQLENIQREVSEKDPNVVWRVHPELTLVFSKSGTPILAGNEHAEYILRFVDAAL